MSSSPPEGPRLLTLGLGRRAVDTQERPVRSGVRGQGAAHGREAGRPFRRKAEAASPAGARIRAERQVRPAPRDPHGGACPTRRAVEAACAGGRRAEGRRRGRPQQPDGAAGGRVFTPGLWAPATPTPEALLPRVRCGSVRVASRAVVRRVLAGLPVVCSSRRESCTPLRMRLPAPRSGARAHLHWGASDQAPPGSKTACRTGSPRPSSSCGRPACRSGSSPATSRRRP